MKIYDVAFAFLGALAEATKDGDITVNDLFGLVQTAVNRLGVGEKVLLKW